MATASPDLIPWTRRWLAQVFQANKHKTGLQAPSAGGIQFRNNTFFGMRFLSLGEDERN